MCQLGNKYHTFSSHIITFLNPHRNSNTFYDIINEQVIKEWYLSWYIPYKIEKSDNGFALIAAQPLLEPLLNMLNMHTASYMSVITYLNMLPYTKGHTIDPWNKCPKRGLWAMDGQIPIKKHYRSCLPLMLVQWLPKSCILLIRFFF